MQLIKQEKVLLVQKLLDLQLLHQDNLEDQLW